jgi:phenylalanyl-tRNA synthetase alpha chain|mmetsp:Transcript_15024/g.19749  ORF Transcript_15024/g.19749 Transcript_15024/m.19749 type:complete len:419 (-) Transcript_15024:84-1340(-)
MKVLSLAIAAFLATAVQGFTAPAPVFGTRAVTSKLFSASAPVEDYTGVERYSTDDPNNNVPPHIAELVGRGLHLKEEHPIGIVRAKIQEYFASLEEDYKVFDAEDPIVTCKQCFDDLRIPPEHPGRSKSDTYYITDDTLLRTHTSAHQSMHLRDGYECFLCAGDVYRRDEIDASHYPAFHQLEGVKLFDPETVKAADGLSKEEWLESDECKMIGEDLKATLEGLMDHLFGPVEKRWADDYFPFTEPSFECEILYEGEWLEVLGCGVIHTEVLEMAGREDRRGWAFGLGLERLAMVLFKIPDIRLFWTDDTRFHKQFKAGEITTFKPYSKYPPCYKDIAMWLPEDYEENDFFEMARGVAGDLVEKIDCVDEFTNPKTNRTSKCYRITYRSMDRSLTDDEVNALQDNLREESEALGCEVR